MIKKIKLLAVAASCMLVLNSCTDNSVKLFNGTDLEGWSAYLEDSTLNSADEFIVKDGVIHLSGKFGYIHTNNVYSNYKLTLEWRWPEVATNSGVFLHTQPEYNIWPENFEYQLMAGKAGDIYCANGSDCAEYAADRNLQVVPKRNPSNEKPVGEWNKAEIICEGNTITAIVNGELQNVVTGTSNSEGYIGLQSEGEAVEFRNVVLTPLKK